MPDLFTGTTALITGASRGIGAAFADLFAARGVNLILVARTESHLHAVAARVRRHGIRAEALQADLADAAAPERLEREVADKGLTVDHLVNNAGIGVHGRFFHGDVEHHRRVLQVNMVAPVELAARFLPAMIARRRGGLLNIGSTAAFQGLAWLPVYAATKASLLNWSEGLWASLRGTGVRCCCLCPGPVDTAFFDANDLTVRPPTFVMQSPDAVARAGLRAYRRDRCVAYSGWAFRLLAWATRVAPRSLAALGGSLYAKPKE